MIKFIISVWRVCGQCHGKGCQWCYYKGGVDTGAI